MKKYEAVAARSYLLLSGHKQFLNQMPKIADFENGYWGVRWGALALRAVLATDSTNERIPRYVQWLMNHRRGGWWYSTLDSAYMVMALSELPVSKKPAKFSLTVNGKAIPLIEGHATLGAKDLRPGQNTLVVKQDGKGLVFGSTALQVFTKAESVLASKTPTSISRVFERAVTSGSVLKWVPIRPGEAVRVGERLRVTLRAATRQGRGTYFLKSPIPAGAEHLTLNAKKDRSGDRAIYDDHFGYAPSTSLHWEDAVVRYEIRPTFTGRYKVMPAEVFDMYETDHAGHSDSFILEVIE